MVKPILQLYPVVRADDEAEREALRPIGRNRERYNEALHGMTELVKAADELGFWGVSSIEHHFHSEGYEVGPNPAMLNAHWASQVKNARVGQLGFTMSAQNPIRVAEDTAIIDHLTRGRCFVGFSRGYQSRWTNVLGQHLGTRATASPSGHSEEQVAELGADKLASEVSDDEINRRIFEDNIDLVVKAWTEESFTHDSPQWQIPYPAGTGVDWAMNESSERLGAPGEIGEDGRVKRVSVAPGPYSDPHPPVFVASNASIETVEYAGSRGFVPTYFSPAGRAGSFGQSYVDAAAAGGRQFSLGQNQALVRWMQIAETTEEAHQQIADYDLEIYRNLYKALTPIMPMDDADPIGSILSSGLWLGGSIDEVRDQFIKQWTELPAEYCVLIYHYAQQPIESIVRNLSLFMEHIKPALDEMTSYNSSPVGA
jgi:alkanesulfonate monooxygenase SsuD/methylene tetrahydromethanopterin reductase-like flavin-dependent oxidoreductase (luciferase family)